MSTDEVYSARPRASAPPPGLARDTSHVYDADQRPGGRAKDYGDLLHQLDQQDRAGGTEATQLRVIAIMDARDHVTAWRVQLPSTQNWAFGAGQAAINDVDTAVMLTFLPDRRIAYDDAVLDAMARAGVFESTAPILLTGWSLGGMEAAHLLSTVSELRHRVESIVVAGAPIDKYRDDFPPAVRVTQFSNHVDPVHRVEGIGLDRADGPVVTWVTHTFTSFEMRIVRGRDVLETVIRSAHATFASVHGAEVYGEFADSVAMRPGDEKFFAASDQREIVHAATYSRSR